jgi:hypothetical protein
MSTWLNTHRVAVGWLFGLSVVAFVATLVAIPLLVIHMSPSYFLDPLPSAVSWRGRYPVIRTVARIAKNVLGILFVLAGIAMLLLPWSPLWGHLVAQLPPEAAGIVDLPAVRGAISGFGAVHFLLLATELVTVALRRADLTGKNDPFANILESIDPERYLILPNTSGAMNADEAVRLAKLAACRGSLGLAESAP